MKRYVIEMLHIKRNKPIIVRVHGIDISKRLKFMSMPKIRAKKELLKFLGFPENLLMKKWYVSLGSSYCKSIDVLIDVIEILKGDQEINAKQSFFFIPKMKLLCDGEKLKEIYEQKLVKLIKEGLFSSI